MSKNTFETDFSAGRISSQAMRDYQRQRQMTLGDLLLENRVFSCKGKSTTATRMS